MTHTLIPAVRVIDWPATVRAVQDTLNGPPQLTQATIASGVTLRNVLSTVGHDYDVLSNDGLLNDSDYVTNADTGLRAWSTAAQPQWLEVDRVARAIYKLLPPPTNSMLAAFGMPGVTPWRPSTTYASGDCVAPSPANGFNYSSSGGTSGPTPPAFQQSLGSQVVDGGTTWTCIAAVTGPSGGQPLVLPWDVTLISLISWGGRAAAAETAAARNLGLLPLIQGTVAAARAIFEAIPPANATADAFSLAVNNGVNAAIANANAWIAAAAIV